MLKHCGWKLLIGLCAILLLSACNKASSDQPELTKTKLSDEELTVFTQTYANLDVSEMTVETPAADKLYKVHFTYDYSVYDSDKVVEYFFKIIKQQYGLDTLDESAIYYTIDDEARNWHPFSEYQSDLNDHRIMFMKYEDETHFYLFYVFSSMAEWFDPVLLNQTLSITEYGPYGWRPYYLNYQIVGSYTGEDLESSEISYPLFDKDVTLREAADLVNDTLAAPFCQIPDFFNSRVTMIDVFQLQDGSYGYHAASSICYDGVKLSDVPSGAMSLYSTDPRFSEDLQPEDGKYHHLIPTQITSYIVSSDTILWAWTEDTFDSMSVQEAYEEVITLDDALAAASREISDEHRMKLSSASLLYATEYIYDNAQECVNVGDYEIDMFPVWQFVVENPGVNGYYNLVIYVDAVTGTVTFYGIKE